MLNERFEQHDTLNPKFWTKEDKLKPEIENKLKQVIDTYIEDSQFLKKGDIATVEIVGSNASYNYSDTSDLDMHLIVDLEKLSTDPQIAQYANDGEKTLFNKRYDIQLKDSQVEVYVQDINSASVSNGIYNLIKKKWTKKPIKINAKIDVKEYDAAYKEVENKAKELYHCNDIKKIQKFIDDLYIKRRQSLQEEGEAGTYNNIFKDLRSKGIMDKLKDIITKEKNKQLSLKEQVNFKMNNTQKAILKENDSQQEEKIVSMSFDKFLDNCYTCGGNWTAMLLSGIKNLYPKYYEAMPDIDYSFEDVAHILEDDLKIVLPEEKKD